MNAPAVASAPGKLLLAGEYAVLEPGRPAVVMAVDRYVTVTAGPPEHAEVELVTDLLDHPVGLRRGPHGLAVCDERDAGHLAGVLVHLAAVVDTVDRLCAESGRGRVPVRLTVCSDLHQHGVKVGLGSSGAVTVAAVRALGDYLGIPLSGEERFRLGMLAGVTVDAGPSGADLAAATWRSLVLYRSPDRDALLGRLRAHGVLETLNAPWPGLSVRILPVPAGVSVHPGWTGRAASTSARIGRLRRTGWRGGDDHRRFLSDSERITTQMAEAVRRDEAPALLAAVRDARLLLGELDRRTGLGISTPLLTALCRTAREAGGEAKPSGAGGGDCGIALLPAGVSVEGLHRRWTEAGIVPLALRPCAPHGSPQIPSDVPYTPAPRTIR
ncbi:phosphomevalonate kinase [Streptomyces lavendulae]|uniref:phosphomevalonate kinase n=1 Tax=Streptomyces lavendulae TaxID=1914 RepID=UPI0024A35B47|nr:phosphomevalonate kinase [Streptomyces lavendulae]GLX19508.1 phosphomevalonate kinase [Streptomyces lavendulae subsp. lavendulae]GLX27003.1 phosphomevalonate kinase [Streptomyces lavendulae subsp. lavendulae]